MKTLKKMSRVFFFGVIAVGVILLSAYFIINARADYSTDEELFRAAKNTSVTHLYANSATDGSYVPTEIEATAFGKAKKVWYSDGEISDYLRRGFIAAEDREFYSHGGVNFRRTFAAFLNYIFKRGERFGASTVTQQVVKNISGDSEVSVKRKLYEIFRAMKIEKNHSKDEILELYMNIAPMSDNIAGVGYAADSYFGKEPDELSLAEAATLVGITNSPSRYDPRKNPEQCKERRNTVLYSMLEMNFITKEEYEEAKSEPLILSEREPSRAYSSWFVETALSDVVSDLAVAYGISEAAARIRLMTGGYNIYTTENPFIQKALEEVFENTDELPPEIFSGLNFAMCINDSQTGDLLGIIGSVGKKRANRLLNLAEAPHPPGSTLKPLALYAPLFDQKSISWSSIFDDSPVTLTEKDGEYILFPHNSPDVYDGKITVKDAVRLSKNTVAVRLYEMLGADGIFSNLKNNFKFNTLTQRSLTSSGSVSDLAPSPLALGQLSYGISLRDLTDAYTVFPREGMFSESRSYLYVNDKNGNTVLENKRAEKRIFAPSSTRIMTQLLMNVVGSGTAKSVSLKDRVDTAGKTGTTADSRDKLFVGYTPYFTAGIWSGYPDKNTSVAGTYPTHLELWDRVMNKIHTLVDCEEHFSTSGLVYRSFCKSSGKIPETDCYLDGRGEGIEWGWFTPDNAPSEYCTHEGFCEEDGKEK